MKRHLFSVVLVVLLLVLTSSVGISETYPSGYDPDTGVYDSKSTDKRNVFEFCDLFQSRIARIEDKYGYKAKFGDFEFIDYGIVDALNAFAAEDQYFATLSAGNAYINVPDFTIGVLSCELISSYTDENYVQKNIARAISAISALEYTSLDDFSFKVNHTNFYGGSSLPLDAVESSINIFSNYISPKFKDSSFMENVQKAEDLSGILVYSGRYNYYLRYSSYTSKDDEFYYSYSLVAVAK